MYNKLPVLAASSGLALVCKVVTSLRLNLLVILKKSFSNDEQQLS